jgi:hypothetical protein
VGYRAGARAHGEGGQVGMTCLVWELREIEKGLSKHSCL